MGSRPGIGSFESAMWTPFVVTSSARSVRVGMWDHDELEVVDAGEVATVAGVERETVGDGDRRDHDIERAGCRHSVWSTTASMSARSAWGLTARCEWRAPGYKRG